MDKNNNRLIPLKKPHHTQERVAFGHKVLRLDAREWEVWCLPDGYINLWSGDRAGQWLSTDNPFVAVPEFTFSARFHDSFNDVRNRQANFMNKLHTYATSVGAEVIGVDCPRGIQTVVMSNRCLWMRTFLLRRTPRQHLLTNGVQFYFSGQAVNIDMREKIPLPCKVTDDYRCTCTSDGSHDDDCMVKDPTPCAVCNAPQYYHPHDPIGDGYKEDYCVKHMTEMNRLP